MINIKKNIDKVKNHIHQACQQYNNTASIHTKKNVNLLAVSKTKSASDVEEAYNAGQHHFGENYLQEALNKIDHLSYLPDICWHFIGPIQSNKTKQIANNFSWIQSVDRIKIAKRLNEQCTQNVPLNICLQVNISAEASKSGVNLNDVFALAEMVNNCDKLILRGLMAIPEKNAPNSSYEKMHHLFTQLKAQYKTVDTLSLGMSGDLALAIANGSTMVRIGTAIFGSRNY